MCRGCARAYLRVYVRACVRACVCARFRTRVRGASTTVRPPADAATATATIVAATTTATAQQRGRNRHRRWWRAVRAHPIIITPFDRATPPWRERGGGAWRRPQRLQRRRYKCRPPNISKRTRVPNTSSSRFGAPLRAISFLFFSLSVCLSVSICLCLSLCLNYVISVRLSFFLYPFYRF